MIWKMVQLLFIRVLRELIWILGSFLSRFSGGKFFKLKKNNNKWKNKTKQNKKKQGLTQTYYHKFSQEYKMDG